MRRLHDVSALLGEDAAEERDVGPELLRQGVQAGKGSEVHHAVGGLRTVLHGGLASCRSKRPLTSEL